MDRQTSGYWRSSATETITYRCQKNRTPWEITSIAAGVVKESIDCLVTIRHISQGVEQVSCEHVHNSLLGKMFVPLKVAPGDKVEVEVVGLDRKPLIGKRVYLYMEGQVQKSLASRPKVC